jgi:hypothetical protein
VLRLITDELARGAGVDWGGAVFFFFFFNIDRSSEEKTTETVGHVDEGTAKV